MKTTMLRHDDIWEPNSDVYTQWDPRGVMKSVQCTEILLLWERSGAQMEKCMCDDSDLMTNLIYKGV